MVYNSDMNKKIKVCHLSSAHGQEDTRIFHKECKSLAEAGYEVYLITRGRTYDKDGVHIIGVSRERVSRIERMVGTVHEVFLKAAAIDADIYHAHDPELLPVCAKLKKRGKKVIFDSHEHVVASIREKTYLPKMLRRIMADVYSIYQRAVCTKLDAVITATPNVSEYFKKIKCKNVVDLCNFPILNEFREPDYCSRALSFAGNMEDQWNHDVIIKSLENVENVKYILCGSPQENYLAKLKALKGWEKVDYRGRIPFEAVQEVLSGSAVGLSILTPGGNTDGINGNMANTKVFEEMMAGLPVICSKFRRWREFVEEYDCGICVHPHNEKEIKAAIERLINNPDEARRMGHNGRKAVEERFNWAREEKKLLELYNRIKGAEI